MDGLVHWMGSQKAKGLMIIKRMDLKANCLNNTVYRAIAEGNITEGQN
jgi:hypothetical protein